MQRNAVMGIVGVVVVSALVVGIGASALGNPAPSVRPSAIAQTPSSTPSASASAAPSATATATASPTPVPTPTPLPTPVLVPAPLTGRPVTVAVSRRHPIAVMIDDLGAARPQSGLSQASVVWQAPAEGGIPRYMAIFQDSLPKEIGPVRSSRYYYIAWAAEWRAVYAHAGGSPQAKATLAAKGHGQYVYNIDEFRYSGTFFRVYRPGRFAPHNLYTTSTKLRAAGKHQGAKDKTYSAAWKFAPDAPLEARPYGGTISVKYPYNAIKYTYDRKTNTYLRTVTGEKKETDAGNKVRIAPANVIVMRMRFGPLSDGHPGAPRLEATVIGSGTAWIFTNGRTIKGTWKKTAMTKPTRFYDKDGNQVTLTIGQTFVQVIPGTYPFSYKPGSNTPPATPSPSPS